MKMTFELDTIITGDCIPWLESLPDNCADLILTDPPYYKVKADAWDNQWGTPAAFLTWLDTIAAQWQRVLKPNGSLYCFASPQMAARVEVLLSERFAILNHITWMKNSDGDTAGPWCRACKDELRAYFPQTERIIFAEHPGAHTVTTGAGAYTAKCAELRAELLEPLRAYIAGEFKRAGMLNTAGKIAANVVCGFSPAPGGMAARHYFGRSQWWLPTRKHYHALRELLNHTGADYLARNYSNLETEYNALRREYEIRRTEFDKLRSPFAVTPDVHYTDVWTFTTVKNAPGKHPCEKPAAMLEHIITASTLPGAVVLDCFAGSGSTLRAAYNLGRRFLGCELSPQWARAARRRFLDAKGGPLFAHLAG